MANIGRNDPCPCGSGKKHKKCCLQQAFPQQGNEQRIMQRLIGEILSYAKTHHVDEIKEAYEVYWDVLNPDTELDPSLERMADINLWEWFVHDWLPYDDTDKPIIVRYKEHDKKLTPEELKILGVMQNSVLSLYEVQETFTDRGMLLKDLLMGGEYDVAEKLATQSFRKWDIFSARLLFIDGHYILSGGLYPFSLKEKQNIIKAVKDAHENFQQIAPEIPLDDFLKIEAGPVFHYLWFNLIQNPSMPEVRNTDGDPIMLCTATYTIKDKAEAVSRLNKIEVFSKHHDDEWIWERGNDKSSTSLGRIEIKGKLLIFECNSENRLATGKSIIQEYLSGIVIHKKDTKQDMAAAMAKHKKHPGAPPEELPMEIQQQFYTQFMMKHSEEWLHEKIPALNGQTPMDAVKTEEGRRKVIELLKSFENQEEHNKRSGKPYIELAWMWERLNLERE